MGNRSLCLKTDNLCLRWWRSIIVTLFIWHSNVEKWQLDWHTMHLDSWPPPHPEWNGSVDVLMSWNAPYQHSLTCTVQLTARQAGIHSSLLNLSCFALISVQKVPKRFIVLCTVEQVVKLHNEVLTLFFFELLNYSLSLVILKGFCLFLWNCNQHIWRLSWRY